MGELSEQNRALIEREASEITAEYLLAGHAIEIGPRQLARLLDAARYEGQPSGYDGGKSLGEDDLRYLAGLLADQIEGGHCGEGNFELRARDRHNARVQRLIAFTSTLSDGGEGEEFLEFKEALSDLRSLRAEHRDLNGGGPGWSARNEAAWARVNELFANEDEAAWVRQQEDAHG